MDLHRAGWSESSLGAHAVLSEMPTQFLLDFIPLIFFYSIGNVVCFSPCSSMSLQQVIFGFLWKDYICTCLSLSLFSLRKLVYCGIWSLDGVSILDNKFVSNLLRLPTVLAVLFLIQRERERQTDRQRDRERESDWKRERGGVYTMYIWNIHTMKLELPLETTNTLYKPLWFIC